MKALITGASSGLGRELGQNMHRTDIRVDHAQLFVQIGVQKLAEQAEARIIYHDLEIVAAHRTVQQAAFLLIAHIRRDHMAHGRHSAASSRPLSLQFLWLSRRLSARRYSLRSRTTACVCCSTCL